MSDRLILVLDEGTTSTRAMLFDARGGRHGVCQAELKQYYPRSGWVEHDAGEIWDRTVSCAREMVEKAGGADNIAAIGITNQRETVVAWDRQTGQPLAHALVWQDRRTADYCAAMRAAGYEDAVRAKTGLLLDPYFSATKMRWLLENEPAVKSAAQKGTLAFGTVESWLVYNLTGGNLAGGLHVSDASNASRTLLLGLEDKGFDQGLCDMFDVPFSALPEVVDNAGAIGTASADIFGKALPICGMAGDQQSATIGQGCLSKGDTKATYGTGAFVLANKGEAIPTSDNRLLGTVLHQLDGKRHYALEGSVFVAGSLVQWLRDSLGLISSAAQTEELVRSVKDNGGVVVVPALSGLGAPHWLPDARGAISGLSFSTGKAHIVRAALESMAHQTRDLAQAFAADGAEWTSLKVDGGMVANGWMVQDIADLLEIAVIRPDFAETTALGAAMLAALGAGIHADLPGAAAAMIGQTSTFTPAMDAVTRGQRLSGWAQAIGKM